MSNIDNFIIEKLKINKNSKQLKEEVINNIKEIVNDVLQNKFDLNYNQYILGTSTKDGFIANDINNIDYVYVYFKSICNYIFHDNYKEVIKELKNNLTDYIKSFEESENKINNNLKLKFHI